MKTQPITLDIGRRRIVRGIQLGTALLLCGGLALGLVSRTAETDGPRATTAVVAQPYNADLAALKLEQAERVADTAMVLPLPQAVTRADFVAFKQDQAERVADTAMVLPLPQAVTRADFVAFKQDQAEQVADAAMALPLPQAVTRADFVVFKLDQAEQVADAAMVLPLPQALIWLICLHNVRRVGLHFRRGVGGARESDRAPDAGNLPHRRRTRHAAPRAETYE